MTSLSLYKWITEWQPEWRYERNDEGDEDVIIWISPWVIESFLNLFEPNSFPDTNCFPAYIRHDGICLFMRQICDRHDIALEDVFSKHK